LTNKEEHGGYGPRRHLLLCPASETKTRVDNLSSLDDIDATVNIPKVHTSV